MPGPDITAEGVTNPSIDDLLTKTDSKYQLVLYSAKRARHTYAYYSQLGEGLLEYVGPLVETHVQEKPLSIALREISEDLLTCEDSTPSSSPPRRPPLGLPPLTRKTQRASEPPPSPTSRPLRPRPPAGAPALASFWG